MRRTATLLAALTLIGSPCGGSDEESPPAASTGAPVATPAATTQPAPATAPATDPPATDPPATDPPATTRAAESTTTAAPEPDERAIRIAGAALLAGDWSGTWTNTTFGSTGPIEVSLTVNSDAGFLVADADIGGFVFGIEDLAPAIFELDLVVGPPYTMRSELLGEFTLDLASDGTVMLDASDVPAEGIASMTISGSLTPAGVEATYEIELEGGGGAEGTIEVSRQG